MLRDCISVLIDLTVQIRKLEDFFTMLTQVIDDVILVRAGQFVKTMDKVGTRTRRDGYVKADDQDKQTIYISTLQLKAYFGLLGDISKMYSTVHWKYIRPGMDLCSLLAKGAAGNKDMSALQDELVTYTQRAAKAVAVLVDKVTYSPFK